MVRPRCRKSPSSGSSRRDSTGLSLRAIYVPFFTPHIVSVVEGKYAIFPPVQNSINDVLTSLGLTGSFAANLSRADRERLAESGLAAFAPEANLRSGQTALRATMHGLWGELGVTAATALEKLPAFRASPELVAVLRDPSSTEALDRLQAQPRPVQIDYNRFAVFSADAAFDVAPLSLGFEAAYMLHRTLYAAGQADAVQALPQPDTSDFAQLGARLEYIDGSEWLVVLEASIGYALGLPAEAGRSWVGLPRGRYNPAAAMLLAWAPDFGLHVELGAALLAGPDAYIGARVGYELVHGFEVELGALLIEGAARGSSANGGAFDNAAALAAGALFDDADQLYLGLRYKL
jgi:hypothetical protein